MQSFLSRGRVNQATNDDFGYLIRCDIETASREVIEKTEDHPLIIKRDISPITRVCFDEENRPVASKNMNLIGGAQAAH